MQTGYIQGVMPGYIRFFSLRGIFGDGGACPQLCQPGGDGGACPQLCQPGGDGGA